MQKAAGAPAGKNVINPTAMILSGVMMLRHLKLFEEADRLEDAVLVTLEDGKAMTRDVVGDRNAASTSAFAETILGNLGRAPKNDRARQYRELDLSRCQYQESSAPVATRDVGLDVFVESSGDPDSIGRSLETLTGALPFKLKMISNRGTKLYPSSGAVTDTVNHWRCRFMLKDSAQSMDSALVSKLLGQVESQFRWMHIEKLQEVAGAPGFTKAQGED